MHVPIPAPSLHLAWYLDTCTSTTTVRTHCTFDARVSCELRIVGFASALPALPLRPESWKLGGHRRKVTLTMAWLYSDYDPT